MTNLYYEFNVSDHHFAEIVRAVREAGGDATGSHLTLDGLTAGYSYTPGRLRLQFEPAASDNIKYPDEVTLIKLIEKSKATPVPSAWPPKPAEVVAETPVVELADEPLALPPVTEESPVSGHSDVSQEITAEEKHQWQNQD